MKKIIKIISLIVLILLLIQINHVSAVDLNLTENTISGNSTSNQVIDDDYENLDETINKKQTSTPSATISAGIESDSGLNFSDILDIFLIVIGTLIILLAIAILIRLKN